MSFKKTCEVEGMFANSIITVVVAVIIGGGGWISHFAQVYSASVYSCFLFSYSSPTAHSPLAPEQLPFPRSCLFVCDLLILTRAWLCGCRFGRIYWSLVGSPLGTQLKTMAVSSLEYTSCQSIAQRGSIGAHKPLSNP